MDKSLARLLPLLVFFSNDIHLVTMGMFYRSSKPMLAPLLMGGDLLCDVGHDGRRKARRAALARGRRDVVVGAVRRF